MPFAGFLNYRTDWTLTINGVNYKAAVEPGESSFEQSLFDVQDGAIAPLLTEGRILLTTGNSLGRLPSGKTLDPTRNGDFKEGRPVVFSLGSAVIRTRILGSLPSNDVDGFSVGDVTKLELIVGCRLSELDRDFPRQFNPEFFQQYALPIAPGVTALPWYYAVMYPLITPTRANGAPFLTEADFDLTGLSFINPDGSPDTYGASADETLNPAQTAANLAGLRGYALYQDWATEQIKFARYPLRGNAVPPVKRLELSEIASYEAQPGLEPPVDKAIATTTGWKTKTTERSTAGEEGLDETAVGFEVWPKVIRTLSADDNGQPITLETRTEQQPAITATSFNQSYTITTRQDKVFDNDNPATFTKQSATISRTFTTDGRPLTDSEAGTMARGVLAPDIFPEDTDSDSYKNEQVWLYSPSGFISREYTRETRPAYAALDNEDAGSAPITAKETGFRYQRVTAGQWEKIPYQLVPAGTLENAENLLATNLVFDPTFNAAIEYLDALPAPPLAPQENETEPVTENAEVDAESIGDSSGNVSRLSISGGTNQSHAGNIAALKLALSQQRRLVFDITRPLTSDESFTPFLREDIGDRVHIRDGQRTSFNEAGGAIYGFTGNVAGKLSKRITVADRDAIPSELPSENAEEFYTIIARFSSEITLVDVIMAPRYLGYATASETSIVENSDIVVGLMLSGSETTIVENSDITVGLMLEGSETTVVENSDISLSPYDLFVDRLTGTYDVDQLAAIEQFFIDIEAAGLLNVLDVFQFYRLAEVNTSDMILNWLAENPLAANFGYTETVNGFESPSITNGYISTGYNPSTAARYALNSATVGFYTPTTTATSGERDSVDLADSAATDRIVLWVDFSDDSAYFGLNTDDARTVGFDSATAAGRNGLHILTRTGATTTTYYRDASGSFTPTLTTVGTGSASSSAVPNSIITMGGEVTTGVYGAVNSLEAFFAGAGMTSTQATDFAAAYNKLRANF